MRYLFLLCILAACSAPGDVSMKKEALAAITVGQDRASVLAELGAPAYESSDVMKYCTTGLGSDTYYTIAIKDGLVSSVSRHFGTYIASGSCGLAYGPNGELVAQPRKPINMSGIYMMGGATPIEAARQSAIDNAIASGDAIGAAHLIKAQDDAQLASEVRKLRQCIGSNGTVGCY